METEKINEFYRDGLLSIKVLRRITGVDRSAIHNRFARGTNFREKEIDALRVIMLPLFRRLFEDYFPVNGNENEDQEVEIQ